MEFLARNFFLTFTQYHKKQQIKWIKKYILQHVSLIDRPGVTNLSIKDVIYHFHWSDTKNCGVLPVNLHSTSVWQVLVGDETRLEMKHRLFDVKNHFDFEII